MTVASRSILAATVLLFCLAGCGKPGSTIAPAGSPYPRFYPNPVGTLPDKPTDDIDQLPPDQTKPLHTKEGSYIDPSVRALQLAAPTIQPGSNMPYSRPVSDAPLSQGLGAPNQSPLPPPESMRPDEGNTSP
jgi:hypothetical protein